MLLLLQCPLRTFLVCFADFSPVKGERHHLRDLLPDFDRVRPLGVFHDGVNELAELILVNLFESDTVRMVEDGVGDVGACPVHNLPGHALLGPDAHQAVYLCWVRVIHGSSNTHACTYSKPLTSICIAWKTFKSFDDALFVKSSYWLLNQHSENDSCW